MGADASKDQIWALPRPICRGDAEGPTYRALDRLIDNALAYNRDFVAPTPEPP